MNYVKQITKYVFADIISSSLAWALLFVYRKEVLEPSKFGYRIDLDFDTNFWLGLLLIPIFWIILYALSGQYNDIYRRHRIKELGNTLLLSIIGSLIVFFVLLLDDQIANYKSYYLLLFFYFTAHFGLNFIVRIYLTSKTVKRVHRKIIGFNTIIIGGSNNGVDIFNEINLIKNSPGYRFLGFVSMNGGKNDPLLKLNLSCLGNVKDIQQIIKEHQIEEVIIALESSEHKQLEQVITLLDETDVRVKIIPDMYDIMSGSVKMNSIFGVPLIEVNTSIMQPWQFSLKRIFDVFISIFAIIFLSPVFIIVGVLVKYTSKGPMLFKQERIGLYKAPFLIYKFRSMSVDAEKNGPQLSSDTDNRITPIGKFLRKTRLDEFPQFFNVLKGDMSMVGPRPERQFFIDQIVKEAPHYAHLHKVKPGITSWGQVKYGYAENVKQMVQRLKYDVLYIENMSFAMDLKILFYTVLTVLKGSGK
ncbi:MAG: exopolysaccharide biosynthesis polyprenyl glycosylphosphotransferase [Flavobacteriales bacterium]|jgi:exopolysaccharide biosynthesis polyprenyl glycosylphosphotransferase